jgi:DNA-binding GntR family transcriptional regulator
MFCVEKRFRNRGALDGSARHTADWQRRPGAGIGSASRIKRISVSQQIHDALRERIIALEFVPGQNLSRAEIADFFGGSQTPVRDAMLKLEEEGGRSARDLPQSKTEVSRIDVEQARETQFLRLSIELDVTRRLTLERRPDQLASARKLISAQKATLRDGDLEQFSHLDRKFHHALCEAAGVANLWQLVTSRSGHIDRLQHLNLPHPGKPDNILHYHKEILRGIEAGNIGMTEKAVREHLSGTLTAVDQIVARHPDYF